MPSIDRRRFLQGAAGAATAIAVGGPFQGFTATAANANGRDRQNTLRAVPDLRDGKVRLWLPEGFQYRSFHDTDLPAGSFVTLDDGTRLPGRHDGMGAFRLANENVMLVRNHEINGPVPPPSAPEPRTTTTAGSGTTSVEVTLHGEVVRSFTSLNGTQMNCSGGIMPWGSWVSCEETVNGPDVGPDFTSASNVHARASAHGYIFEVPAGGQSNARADHARRGGSPTRRSPSTRERGALPDRGQLRLPVRLLPLRALGEPDEDRPPRQRRPAADARGRRAAEHPPRGGAATPGRRSPSSGSTSPTRTPIFPYTPGYRPPTTNNDAISFVGDQGRARGAAYFSRLEGAVYDRGVVYFTSTQGGGAAETGPDTVGRLRQRSRPGLGLRPAGQQLRLVYQSPGPDVLDFPDNVTDEPARTL